MRKFKIWAATIGSTVLLAIAGFLLVWMAAGVRAAHANLIIATFAVHGIQSEEDLDQLKERLATFPGYHDASVARHASSEHVWLARVQFKSTDPDAARDEILRWISESPASLRVQPVLATFYEYRLERPGRGDLVFGDRYSILPLD